MSSYRSSELQGTRPPALTVGKSSRKTKRQSQTHGAQSYGEPVIIYTLSPEVIHTSPSKFMDIVQKLTGKGTADVAQRGSSHVDAKFFESNGAVHGFEPVVNMDVSEYGYDGGYYNQTTQISSSYAESDMYGLYQDSYGEKGYYGHSSSDPYNNYSSFYNL